MIKLYGIPNCDTVKRAKDKLYLLGANDFEFVNLKTSPPTTEMIMRWKRAFDDNWPVNDKSRVFKEFKNSFEKAELNSVYSKLFYLITEFRLSFNTFAH